MAKKKSATRPTRGSAAARSSRTDPAAAIRNAASVKVIRIAEALNRGAARVYGTQYNLKNTELRILGNLSQPSPVTIGELSRRARIDKAWISRSLPDLRKRQLITLTRDPNMRSAKLIGLTRRGTALLAKIAPVTLSRAQHLLSGVDPVQAEAMLDRLLQNAIAFEEQETGAWPPGEEEAS
jgi:DNA-binding MarR family transcriptional regulator